MAIDCPSCIYYKADDTTCRRHSPPPGLTGNPTVVWPKVQTTDWCAEGWNPTDGWYDRSPTPAPDYKI